MTASSGSQKVLRGHSVWRHRSRRALIRMLIVGYCYTVRSERRLCEEVTLNLA